MVAKPPAEYHRSLKGLTPRPLGYADDYAPQAGYALGWPIGYDVKAGTANLTHCYGYVGVGRDLDRNIAVVGRVIEGIDRLSSLPRGTEALGFYKEESQNVPISMVRLASEIPATDRPAFEYMDTGSPSFADYLRIRSHRLDDFYRQSADGVDLCNVQVPVRRKAPGERG